MAARHASPRSRSGLAGGGRRIRTIGPPAECSVFRNRPGHGDGKPARQPEPVLTIDKHRFTVRRARLALAMISTPGHRASRRRQRGALPAWSLFGSSRPMPGDAVYCRSSIYVTSRWFVTRCEATTIENAAHWRPGRFRIRSSRGGRPYRGGPRVRIHLPPARSQQRTIRLSKVDLLSDAATWASLPRRRGTEGPGSLGFNVKNGGFPLVHGAILWSVIRRGARARRSEMISPGIPG
jgi:hypothetical protein